MYVPQSASVRAGQYLSDQMVGTAHFRWQLFLNAHASMPVITAMTATCDHCYDSEEGVSDSDAATAPVSSDGISAGGQTLPRAGPGLK